MKTSIKYWFLAAAISAFVHGMGMLPFAVSSPSVQIERSAGAPVEIASQSAMEALQAGLNAPQSVEAEPEPVDPQETKEEAETAQAAEVEQIDPVETATPVVEDVVQPVETQEQAKATPDTVRPNEPVEVTAKPASSEAPVKPQEQSQATPETITPTTPTEVAAESESSEAPLVPTASGIAVAAVEASSTKLKEAVQVRQTEEVKATEPAPAPTEALQPVSQPTKVARVDPVAPRENLEAVKPETEVREISPVEELKPVPRKKPEAKKKPEVKKKPEARKKAKAKKKKKTRKKTKAKKRKKVGERSVASVQRSGSRTKGRASQKAGDGGRNKGVTGRAAVSNYVGKIVSRLQRQKRYPAGARRAKKEGTAVVAFTIQANGRVSGVRLKRSSGHPALDREVRNMIKRAQPFPPVPSNAGRKTVSVSVPIDFNIR